MIELLPWQVSSLFNKTTRAASTAGNAAAAPSGIITSAVRNQRVAAAAISARRLVGITVHEKAVEHRVMHAANFGSSLISQEVRNHQFRFQAIIDPDDGLEAYRVEHVRKAYGRKKFVT